MSTLQPVRFSQLKWMPVEDVGPLVDALHAIAVYSEGPEVTGSFDEPAAARVARIALEPFLAKYQSDAMIPADGGGVVPVVDLWPLVRAANEAGITHPLLAQELIDVVAKHPNLFPK